MSTPKSITNKIHKMLKNPFYFFCYATRKGFINFLPDKTCLSLVYRGAYGRKLNLDNPTRYSEKLQWIKLYDRCPLYSKLVDKYEVKSYVSERIGEEYIIPTLGVWNAFDDINFENLPEQFVLKCTHDSGGLVICTDKKQLNIDNARTKINKSLKTNYYKLFREWPYKNVTPRIVAEKFMVDNATGELRDYKFYCFDGVVRALGIYSDRGAGKTTKADYFDRDFNWLDLKWGYEHAIERPEKPSLYDKMIEIAESLSQGFPEVRVDLYLCNNRVYFGELTFFDGGGFDSFEPDSWDEVFGSWIALKNRSIKETELYGTYNNRS